MIPYFKLTTISIGPVHIYIWGLLVLFGMAMSLLVAYPRARKFGISKNQFIDCSIWAIIASFVGARLGHVFFYDWHYFAANPLDIFKIWQGGLSSFGGFIGAVSVVLIYARINKFDFWSFSDSIMYAFPLGLGIGRLGCFLNHLHIGKFNSSFLAVDFPGGSRLDMGLLESLFGFLLFLAYFVFYRNISKKIFLPLTMVLYGSTRFIFDFERATDIVKVDIRYAGLTPAQYGSLLLICGGLYMYKNVYNRKEGKILK